MKNAVKVEKCFTLKLFDFQRIFEVQNLNNEVQSLNDEVQNLNCKVQKTGFYCD